ncbi:Smr/MutS family protein [Gelidibacter maritimus]|uniref:DNA mismatch repair protein MutS n=1 Tax=Gelidibacter maritimus TaxID=2761487 RepID=A0A7W2M4J0_9FLAO|nr:Smr/MutS family protein [Gelidibacter maritimus]MBA6152550.1 DNA mismatch repair protein MutS [Gelidibacter maritimus]
MDLNVGDKVTVLDEDISGIVSKIDGLTVYIETDDGFLLDFQTNELLKMGPNDTLRSRIFSEHSFTEVLSEKEQPTKRQSVKVKPKDRNQPKMEVDLHIHNLTENQRNLSKYDMLNLQLDTARSQLEFAIRKRIQKIVFIHGVGEGVLKMELETLFSRYNNVKYYDADFKKYGLGATEVYVYQNA